MGPPGAGRVHAPLLWRWLRSRSCAAPVLIQCGTYEEIVRLPVDAVDSGSEVACRLQSLSSLVCVSRPTASRATVWFVAYREWNDDEARAENGALIAGLLSLSRGLVRADLKRPLRAHAWERRHAIVMTVSPPIVNREAWEEEFGLHRRWPRARSTCSPRTE